MTDERFRLWRRVGLYGLATVSTVANGLEVLGAEQVTPAGLVIAGLIGTGALLPAVYDEGYHRGARRSGDTGAELAVRNKELTTIRSVLDSTLGAYRPYQERRTIIFDIGEQAEDDLIEEHRRTTPLRGPVVYWSQFEALTHSPHHSLSWDDIELRINRTPEDPSDPQRAKVIQVRDRPIPRALILFAPPWHRVDWTAHYRSPGHWDPLREAKGQRFVWAPPLIRREENGTSRTPVRSVTFVLRLPSALGVLDCPSPPEGIAFDPADQPHDGVRTYRFTIDDLNAFLAARPPAEAAIKLMLLLDPEGN
ncbi:hypothetical protein [Actinoplanes sp. NPDC023714]|uniref:hypothetical protein n=1 Tax=Actinoplanes sp. NPDC023714 TaxID=3154322 RepID=UPI0033E3B05C